MNIAKRLNSSSGAKYVKQAMSMAARLKLKFQSKKVLIDGFIVEGKKAGKLRSASVIDLPQDVVLIPNELVNLSTGGGKQYKIDPFTFSIPNRDALSPNTENNIDVISPKHDGFYTKNIVFGDIDTATASSLSYMGVAHIQGKCASQAVLLKSTDHTLQGLSKTVLKCHFISKNVREITSFQIGGDAIHQMFQRDSLPIRQSTLDNGPADESNYFAYIAERDNSLLTWLSNGKQFALMSTFDNHYYDVSFDSLKPNSSYSDQKYCTYKAHLSMIVLQYSENKGSHEAWGKTLDIDAFLPDWLLGDSVYLAKKHGVSTVPVKAARAYKLHSIKELDNGEVVIACAMKKIVPIGDVSNIPTVALFSNRNNERGYLALVSLKITMLDEDIVSVDVVDAEVLCGQNLYDLVTELPPYSNINRDSFSTDMMLDVLSDGGLLCRRQVLERPEKNESAIYDGFYPLTDPFYLVTIDGVANEPMSSVESSSSYYGYIYILQDFVDAITIAANNSAKVSESITAVQWYEPVPQGGLSKIGIMFIDTEKDRFEIELKGLAGTQEDFIGISCPQQEVRDSKGKLVTPSVLLATLRVDGKIVVMTRKGPIFDDDKDSNSSGEENEYWSLPVEADTPIKELEETVLTGILFAKGSNFSGKEHGSYFNDGGAGK